MSVDTPKKTDPAELLKIHLTEYENLRTAAENQVKHEQQLMLYLITLSGALFAIVGALVKAGTSSIPSSTLSAILGLAFLAPILYCALTMLMIRRISQIIEIVHYVNIYLRPKIIEIVGKPVIGWDIYLTREPRMHWILKVPLHAARLFLFVVPSTLSLLFFLYLGLTATGDSILAGCCIGLGALFDIAIIVMTLVTFIGSFLSWRKSEKEQEKHPILEEKS